VCDLGFFNAIQSLQQEETAASIEDLISHVKNAFSNYSPILLERIWITYQQCMLKTLEVNGGNNYANPHMYKHEIPPSANSDC
jgi:hypothetical protein